MIVCLLNNLLFFGERERGDNEIGVFFPVCLTDPTYVLQKVSFDNIVCVIIPSISLR